MGLTNFTAAVTTNCSSAIQINEDTQTWTIAAQTEDASIKRLDRIQLVATVQSIHLQAPPAVVEAAPEAQSQSASIVSFVESHS